MASLMHCPMCKEDIKVGAQICRHCQHVLTPEELTAGERTSRSKSIRNALLALGGVFLLGWCVSNSSPNLDDGSASSSVGSLSLAPVEPAIEVKTDDTYAKASADAHCGARYPADFAMRAACGRNADSGRVDFIDIWNRYLSVPAMISALENCFDRYTQVGVTDFAMAGACARNQERGYLESVGG